MLDSSVINRIEDKIGRDRLLMGEPMDKHTTFRAGGQADVYLAIEGVEELKSVLQIIRENNVPYYIIGNGSNILVSDNGFPGIILELGQGIADIQVTDKVLKAGAGALLSSLAMTAYRNSLTGLEFASGIPGTVGGAMVMNAGAYGGEMSQVVSSVQVLDRESLEVRDIACEDMGFAYRHSIVSEQGLIVVGATFTLSRGNATDIKAAMDDYAARRRDKQPLEYPSAGSTFKRPEGFYAGALIEESGLKGYTVGGAQVSEKHAGFVINRDHATASDIYHLICEVREQVYADSGIKLEPEVVMVGNFS